MAAKSYSTFTLDDIKELGITIVFDMFIPKVTEVEPSAYLLETLERTRDLPLSSEKAKSEFVVAPVLNELRSRNKTKMTFFSGYTFSVDKKQGLTGRCDFILSLHPKTITIQAPLFCAVEAKDDTPDDERGIAQCIAEMYAAQIFNTKKGNEINVIYGAVTNGFEWVMMKLENKTATVELGTRYSVLKLPELLGVLQYIVDEF